MHVWCNVIPLFLIQGVQLKRALIVDDDRQLSALTERWLMAAGYDVVVSNDFSEGRMQIQVRKPDVVVADVRLGEFNGLQLGWLAREVRPDVHLVIISGWDDCVLRRDVTSLGAAFVQKPFQAAELLAAIAVE
jgi:DNA-binding response OmpR family regulator